MHQPASRIFLMALSALWCLGVFAGFTWLTTYAATAGKPATPPKQIQLTPFSQVSSNEQLLVFLHPHCSCSQATLHELDRVLASVAHKPDVHIFFADVREHDSIKTSALWQQAQLIDDAKISIDENDLAQQLSVHTSGGMLLYNMDGKLLFNGGITASRGHEGDNAGKAQLVNALKTSLDTSSQAAVFGCALSSPSTI